MLEKIKTGKIQKPLRIMIAGLAGVGKSTFASQAEKPLFLDCEQRTEHLDVARVVPHTWEEIMAAMRELYATGKDGKLPYKTLVVDTLDHAEMLLWRHLCDKNSWQNIEEPGYGKGFNIALEEWRKFCLGIEALRDVGMNVILLAHTEVRSYAAPEGENYDTNGLRLHKRAAGLLVGLMDAVGFACFSDVAIKKRGELKAKAMTTGERELRWSHSPAYISKPGLGLPDKMSLDWKTFMSEVK